MNIVTIKQDEYFKYLSDKDFIINAFAQSKDYLQRYIHTGEVAFDVFVLQTEDETHRTLFCVGRYDYNQRDHDSLYSICSTFNYPLDSNLNKFDSAMLNFAYCETDGGGFDAFLDVATGPNFYDINSTLIKTYGDDWRQWPDPIKHRALALQMPLTLLFLKVQMSALKTSRKIQKATKRAQSKSMEFRPSDNQKPNIIRLNEKMTLTIDASEKASSRKELIRRCEAWMVRGHYRHYKSGKVVYINPYKKGHGKVNDKIYKTK